MASEFFLQKEYHFKRERERERERVMLRNLSIFLSLTLFSIEQTNAIFQPGCETCCTVRHA